MTRSSMIGSGADEVSYGVTFSTLPGFFADRRYTPSRQIAPAGRKRKR
jgi:hypothetical protein